MKRSQTAAATASLPSIYYSSYKRCFFFHWHFISYKKLHWMTHICHSHFTNLFNQIASVLNLHFFINAKNTHTLTHTHKEILISRRIPKKKSWKPSSSLMMMRLGRYRSKTSNVWPRSWVRTSLMRSCRFVMLSLESRVTFLSSIFSGYIWRKTHRRWRHPASAKILFEHRLRDKRWSQRGNISLLSFAEVASLCNKREDTT